MAKKALIYGVSGQDGAYLCEFLLSKGYDVAGVLHKGGEPLPPAMRTYHADLAGEPQRFLFPIKDFSPDEIYNLASMQPHNITPGNCAAAVMGNARAPEKMLSYICKSKARFFQASSAYIFGTANGRVDEKTKPAPTSVYAKSKMTAQAAVSRFRSKGVFAACGILFNHESPRRGENFVTRKISLGVAKIKLGLENELRLGNLDARRDWGFAGDYVEAMWRMLQQPLPDDYVIATGESHSVREFCQEAFSHVGLDWEKHVKSDPALFRQESSGMEADASKARSVLGWRPKVGFKEIVRLMVDADIKRLTGK